MPKKITTENNLLVEDDEKFIFEELADLSRKLKEAQGLPEELTERAGKMLKRLNVMAKVGGYSAEFSNTARYIEVITSIPWGKKTKDVLDLQKAKEILDKSHYGLEGIKERVLEYLATMKLIRDRGGNAISRSPILLFVGLQGIGKTTMARSISEALGRKFLRISMAALGSSLELRGRSKSIPESEPGQIIKALIRTGVANPVILLDEIEKASYQETLRSDIMATLLEILDPEQNTDFRDYYVDFPINLSDVLFICSANNTGGISTALMDRLEVIKMPSYTDKEKAVIAREYLMPQILEKSGLKPGELEIDPDLWPGVVRPFGYDSGIRSIGRTLESICRKVAKEIVEGKSKKVFINSENLRKYLPS